MQKTAARKCHGVVSPRISLLLLPPPLWGRVGGGSAFGAPNIPNRTTPLPTVRAFTPVFDGLWGRGAGIVSALRPCGIAIAISPPVARAGLQRRAGTRR